MIVKVYIDEDIYIYMYIFQILKAILQILNINYVQVFRNYLMIAPDGSINKEAVGSQTCHIRLKKIKWYGTQPFHFTSLSSKNRGKIKHLIKVCFYLTTKAKPRHRSSAARFPMRIRVIRFITLLLRTTTKIKLLPIRIRQQMTTCRASLMRRVLCNFSS